MKTGLYLDIDMDYFVEPIEKQSVDNFRLYHDRECKVFPVAPFMDKLCSKGLSWDGSSISCFTNHKTSYTHWWISKKQDNVLIHIDAHSDLYRNSSKDLRLLHNGDIGCHNYIWYGIRDCYISEIYWVIPDSLNEALKLDGAERIISKSLIIDKFQDANGLHILMECIVITGEVKQIAVHICTLDQLPSFDAVCSKVTIATSPEFLPAASDELVFELLDCFGASQEIARNIYQQHKHMLNKSPEELREAWNRLNKKRQP